MTNYYSLLRQLLLVVCLSASALLAAHAQMACPTPTALSVVNITSSGATVTFAAPANATSYTVIYAPPGVNPNAGVTVVGTSSPITLTGLVANTLYSVYIQVTCGTSGQSTISSPVNFSTRYAAVTTLPYAQNFDAVTAPTLPQNFTTLDANADGYGWVNTASTMYAKSPTNVMQYTQNPTKAADDWFFTTDMVLLAGATYKLQFSYRAFASTYPEALEVKVGLAATPASQTSTLFTNSNIMNSSYLTTTTGSGAGQVLSFIPTVSGVYYFGFHVTSPANAFYLFVDDIGVTTDAITATQSSKSAGFSAQAAPVPFGSSLNLAVNLLKAGPLQLALHDALGRTVRHSTTAALPVGSSTIAVPEVASLPAGVYFLTIEQGGDTQVIRVTHE